jgi:hypothetical protein
MARRALLALACTSATIIAAAGEAPTSKEYQVEAAFLFNFAKFVEWPAESFADASAPITIGVLGDDPFGRALDDAVRGETIRGRRIVVKRSRRAEELVDCQLVFVAKSESGRKEQALATLGAHPTLTVSDIDGFGKAGGDIQFYLDGTKLRFLINQDEAQKQSLKLSAQLLSLGKPVGDAAPGGEEGKQ